MKYNLCIIDYSGQITLYWNRILNAWVHHKGNASPFTEAEIQESFWAKSGSTKELNVFPATFFTEAENA